MSSITDQGHQETTGTTAIGSSGCIFGHDILTDLIPLQTGSQVQSWPSPRLVGQYVPTCHRLKNTCPPPSLPPSCNPSSTADVATVVCLGTQPIFRLVLNSKFSSS